MPLSSALLVTLVLSAGSERVLVCRPVVEGDPALARADEVAAAVRPLQDLFLDYGVPCESLGEAARAAGRAGLGHGIHTAAEGHPAGARFRLALATAEAELMAQRDLRVPPGVDATAALRRALRELEDTVPRPPPRWPTVAGWALMGAGAAALVAGGVFALQARGQARRADEATTPEDWRSAQAAWRRDRGRGVAALAGGGAALAAGLTLRLAF